MKDVPTAYEIAETDEQRAILRAVLSATEIGSAFLTTPAAPPERVDALRRAFDRMMASKEFASESEKVGLELDPLSGEGLQKLVGELANMPPELLERVKEAYSGR
jgi:hypothetical protein